MRSLRSVRGKTNSCKQHILPGLSRVQAIVRHTARIGPRLHFEVREKHAVVVALEQLPVGRRWVGQAAARSRCLSFRGSGLPRLSQRRVHVQQEGKQTDSQSPYERADHENREDGRVHAVEMLEVLSERAVDSLDESYAV